MQTVSRGSATTGDESGRGGRRGPAREDSCCRSQEVDVLLGG